MTPAEKRDQSLRTVQLPDCCGNCRNYDKNPNTRGGLCLIPRYRVIYTDSNHCDLHTRKPDGGSDE